MPYICTKFHLEILNGFKLIKQTQNIARSKQKGIITSNWKKGYGSSPCTSSDHAFVPSFMKKLLFVCVEVLQPSQPNGAMSSAVSLPNHKFTGQA